MDAAALHERRYQQVRAGGLAGWYGDQQEEVVSQWLTRLEMAGIEPGDAILELGCGAGNLSIELAKRGFRCSGIDHSVTAVELARKGAGAPPTEASIEIVLGDVGDLPFRAGEFDVCLDAHCLHCLPCGPQRRRFFAECYRVLRPGGLLFISSMCGEPLPMYWSILDYRPEDRQVFMDDVPIRQYLEPYEIMAEARLAGFLVAGCRVEKRPREDADDIVLIDARKAVVGE